MPVLIFSDAELALLPEGQGLSWGQINKWADTRAPSCEQAQTPTCGFQQMLPVLRSLPSLLEVKPEQIHPHKRTHRGCCGTGSSR